MNNLRKEALSLELAGRYSTTSGFTTFNLVKSFNMEDIILIAQELNKLQSVKHVEIKKDYIIEVKFNDDFCPFLSK